MEEYEDVHAVGVIMAHPDDETLWAGGTLLTQPNWHTDVYTICRGDDADRAPKYFRVMDVLHATGHIAELDDETAQVPLPDKLVQQTILDLIGGTAFDLVITHAPRGEYSPSHRRHREVSRAVGELWCNGVLHTKQLWLCAYDDADAQHLPLADSSAEMQFPLATSVWETKYQIIHEVYGFSRESWESRTTPRTEAFRRFLSPEAYTTWLKHMDFPEKNER